MNITDTQQSFEPALDPIQEASSKFRPEARTIEEGTPAVLLSTIVGKSLNCTIEPAVLKAYLDKLMEESGNPKDPIERQFLEQLAWAHFRVGDLQVQSASARAPDVAAAFNSAAAKMMNEHRKTGLALREYRAPVVPKQVTVVRQQNVAAGNQNVALIDGKAGVEAAPKNNPDIELDSSQGRLDHVELGNPFSIPAATGRTPELVEAQRVHEGGAATAEQGDSHESALDPVDGPSDSSGQSKVSAQW